MLTTLERLARAQELRDAVLAQESVVGDVAKRVMFKRKEDTLRAVLLGKRQATVNDLDLFNPTDSIRLIAEHFDSLAAADTNTRITAAAYLGIVTKYLQKVDDKTNPGGQFDSPATRLVKRLADADKRQDPAYQRAQLDAFARLAHDVYDVGQRAAKIERQRQRLQAEWQFIRHRNAERYATIFDALKDKKAEAFDTYDRARRGEITDEQGNAIRLEYTRLVDERIAAYKAECEPAEDSNRAERQALDERYGEPGGAIKAGILAASIIPAEQATAWAAAQTITPSAKTALKKKGYPAEQVRSDMAEFYRLTAGRLPALTIRTSRGRASAEGIHGHSSSIINMGNGFNKRVLFHEMGHHLEADPAVLAAAKGFLAKRRESDAVYSLRSLTGNNGYKADEKAYRDSFIDPYVGKYYNYDVTEVMSMGMESFCNDSVLTDRMRKDPEHFALMTGFLRAPADPLFGSVKKVFAQIADAENEVAEEHAQDGLSGLQRLAAGVEFVTPDPVPRVPDWMWAYYPHYRGTFNGADLYECTKLRDPRTKRQKKGWVLLHVPPRAPGEPDPGTKWCPYFDGMEQVQAAAKVFTKTGKFYWMTSSAEIKEFALST